MKIFISFALLMGSLSVSVNGAWAAKPKYGPEGRPIAVPLSADSSYFRKAAAPDFWRLIPFYQAQFNGAACSVASVVNLLNAIRGSQGLTSDDGLVTQEGILKKVDAEYWAERMSKLGWMGKHGLTLPLLGKVVEAALRQYGLTQYEVKVVHVDSADPAQLKSLRAALRANEKSADDFIIANFLQSGFTADSDAGHISPVGAYDAANDRVLILDTDREWYEPYWGSVEAFAKGMATLDSESKAPRGYVWVKKKG